MEKELDELFDGIYDKVFKSCKERLDDVKQQSSKFLFRVFIVMIILGIAIYFNPATKDAFAVVAWSCFWVLLVLMVVARTNYRNAYKQSVIEGIIKGYSEKFYFDASYGVPRTEYLISNFDRHFDEYHSEDRIYGKLDSGESFQMSEIATYDIEEVKDADGKKRELKKQTFRGIYGIVRMNKNIVSQIHVKSNSAFRKYSTDRLEMESYEFEKYYDCLSQDKISTMRVFTSELIEKYNELARFYSNVIEVKIENDKIFFRYRTNNLFEPPLFSSGLKKEFLKNYFRVIFFPIEIMKATIENVNSVYE